MYQYEINVDQMLKSKCLKLKHILRMGLITPAFHIIQSEFLYFNIHGSWMENLYLLEPRVLMNNFSAKQTITVWAGFLKINICIR